MLDRPTFIVWPGLKACGVLSGVFDLRVLKRKLRVYANQVKPRAQGLSSKEGKNRDPG